MLRVLILCTALLLPCQAWALTFVNRADGDSTSTASQVINVPTSTADGNVLWMMIKRTSSTTDPNSGLTGWTQVAKQSVTSASTYWIYCRIASSEPASYTVGWAGADRTGITMVAYAYSGSGNCSTGITVVQTQYTTSDTTVRAATLTPADSSSVLFLFYGVHSTASNTLSTPSNPTGVTSNVDDIFSAAGRFEREIGSVTLASASATGSMDSTWGGAAITDKQAFAIALTTEGGAAASPKLGLLGVGR